MFFLWKISGFSRFLPGSPSRPKMRTRIFRDRSRKTNTASKRKAKSFIPAWPTSLRNQEQIQPMSFENRIFPVMKPTCVHMSWAIYQTPIWRWSHNLRDLKARRRRRKKSVFLPLVRGLLLPNQGFRKTLLKKWTLLNSARRPPTRGYVTRTEQSFVLALTVRGPA